MKQYIYNLIPRLKEFSANLDKKELFVEKPWVIVDDEFNQQKYIFKRDGELIMSLNGQVTIGKWEYLSAAKSLLIDRVQDKILLNQSYIDPIVMVLKKDGLKDGFKDGYITLANEFEMPDLNVADYLRNLYYEKNRIVTLQLKNGEYLELDYSIDNLCGTKVTIEGNPVPDGKFELMENERKVLIKNSRIVKALVDRTYKTDNGVIQIEQENGCPPVKGDLVFQDNGSAADGKYRLGFLNSIIVKNGKII